MLREHTEIHKCNCNTLTKSNKILAILFVSLDSFEMCLCNSFVKKEYEMI